MSIIADGLLIATCLTAAVYCFVLARRLKRFTSTEEGVGQQILQLNKTLEETRAALKEAQSGAKAEAEKLAREVVQARKLAAQLRSMTEHAATAAPAAPVAPRAMPVDSDEAASRNGQQAGFVAAAAVQLDDAIEADDPDEGLDDEEIDPAELDMNAILAASAGEQQLGFLPDADDAPEPEAEADDDEDYETAEGSALEEDQTGEFEEDEEAVDADAEIASGNLLKVERMAL